MAFPNNAFASGFGTSNVYQLFADTVIQYSDTAIWSKGSHTLKMGFQGFRQRINTFYSGNNGLNGTFTFNGQYSGRAESDFLLGLPSGIGTGTTGGTWGQRAEYFRRVCSRRLARDAQPDPEPRFALRDSYAVGRSKRSPDEFRACFQARWSSRARTEIRERFTTPITASGTISRASDLPTVLATARPLSGELIRFRLISKGRVQPSPDHQSAVFVGAQRGLHAAPVSDDHARSGLYPGKCGRHCTTALLLANAPSCVKASMCGSGIRT